MKKIILLTAVAIFMATDAKAELSSYDQNVITNTEMYNTIARKCKFGFAPDYVMGPFLVNFGLAMDRAEGGELGPLGIKGRDKADLVAYGLGGWEEFCSYRISIINESFGLEIFNEH